MSPQRRDSIVEGFEYSAAAAGSQVALVVRRHRIEFVEETIPDGQMAGMIGHRPVPCVDEFTFEMDAGQARALRDELNDATNATLRRPR